jgi:ribonuclease BN (tRNA processing enzyme)
VDAGTGIVRQANAAFLRGVSALRPAALDIAFLTHLHSDHTLGLPDLILTPWIFDRTKPLQLYGPSGTKAMADHILEAYTEDIQLRTTGLERANVTGFKVQAHEILPGVVYQDDNVVVKAFPVKHGSWKEALGYRFEVGSKSVVISGDTSPADSVVNACNGCDALIHEVYAGVGTNPVMLSMSVDQWMKYESEFHTSATELGDIAARAKAKMLIVTHFTLLGNAKPEDMVDEIRKTYTGPILVGRDLDFITP